MSTDERQPWDRQADEPSLWYERFLVYCALGITRSVAGAWRHWRAHYDDTIENISECSYNPPSTWYDNARRYDWSRRATLYDDDLRERWSDDATLEQAKRQRVALFSEIATRTALELREREYADVPVNQVSATMKTASRELREELGTSRTSVNYSILLDKLSPELQKLLVESLDIDK